MKLADQTVDVIARDDLRNLPDRGSLKAPEGDPLEVRHPEPAGTRDEKVSKGHGVPSDASGQQLIDESAELYQLVLTERRRRTAREPRHLHREALLIEREQLRKSLRAKEPLQSAPLTGEAGLGLAALLEGLPDRGPRRSARASSPSRRRRRGPACASPSELNGIEFRPTIRPGRMRSRRPVRPCNRRKRGGLGGSRDLAASLAADAWSPKRWNGGPCDRSAPPCLHRPSLPLPAPPGPPRPSPALLGPLTSPWLRPVAALACHRDPHRHEGADLSSAGLHSRSRTARTTDEARPIGHPSTARSRASVTPVEAPDRS